MDISTLTNLSLISIAGSNISNEAKNTNTDDTEQKMYNILKMLEDAKNICEEELNKLEGTK